MASWSRVGLYAAMGAIAVAAACATESGDVEQVGGDITDDCQPVEICGDGLDNDCDDAVDEDCACNPGEEQSCYTGPPTSMGLGVCRDGVQICTDDATWGDCTGEVTPADEACDRLDNNCDGVVDNDCDPGIRLMNGDRCSADVDCQSGNCECEDFECEVRFCTATDCLCGYGTSGSCDEALTGMPDPQDCDGDGEACGDIDDCQSN